MLTDRKSLYGSVLVDGNKEKDYLDTSVIDWKPSRYTEFLVPQYCESRLDIISFIHYSVVDLWWLIAMANDIIDPHTEVKTGMILKIPSVQEYYSLYNRVAKKDTVTGSFDYRRIV